MGMSIVCMCMCAKLWKGNVSMYQEMRCMYVAATQWRLFWHSTCKVPECQSSRFVTIIHSCTVLKVNSRQLLYVIVLWYLCLFEFYPSWVWVGITRKLFTVRIFRMFCDDKFSLYHMCWFPMYQVHVYVSCSEASWMNLHISITTASNITFMTW